MKQYILFIVLMYSGLNAANPEKYTSISEDIKKGIPQTVDISTPSLDLIKFVQFETDGHKYIFFKTTSNTPTEVIMHAPSCPCNNK